MSSPGSPHAQRAPVTEDADTLPGSGYSSAFAVQPHDADRRSPEQWARAALEDAPRALRLFVLFGWRFGLLLRLGPRPSPTHVLGWSVLASDPQAITLEVGSPLITARKVVRVEPSRVTMTTFVHFKTPIAKALWGMAAPVHHRTEPYLLSRAAAHPASGASVDA